MESKYKVGDEICFVFAGSNLKGKIYRVDREKGYHWVKTEKYNFPVSLHQIVKSHKSIDE